MKKERRVKAILWGHTIGDIVELENGYEVMVKSNELTWEEKNPIDYLSGPSDEDIKRLEEKIRKEEEKLKTDYKNKESFQKIQEPIPTDPHSRTYMSARFVYEKISGYFLILRESCHGIIAHQKPIEILEPSTPKYKVKERCLELLLKESEK